MTAPVSSTAAINTTAPIGRPDDPVLAAFSSQDTTTAARLRACQLALARLNGELRWLERYPDDVDDLLEVGRAVSRRVRALKSLVELELRQHRLNGREPDLDLRGPLARKIISLLVNTLVNVANEMVRADDADKIVETFKSEIEACPDIPWP